MNITISLSINKPLMHAVRHLGLHHLLVTGADVPILGVITRQDLTLVRTAL